MAASAASETGVRALFTIAYTRRHQMASACDLRRGCRSRVAALCNHFGVQPTAAASVASDSTSHAVFGASGITLLPERTAMQ